MDPTGLSSPFGQLVIAGGLLATIVVGIVALRRRK
jgi:LPXTG-motif cell wall-anchored protein